MLAAVEHREARVGCRMLTWVRSQVLGADEEIFGEVEVAEAYVHDASTP